VRCKFAYVPFRWPYRLHILGRRICHGGTACFLFACSLGLALGPKDGDDTFLRNVGELPKICLLPVSCLAYSSILKMELIRSSETSAGLYRNGITTKKIILLIVSFMGNIFACGHTVIHAYSITLHVEILDQVFPLSKLISGYFNPNGSKTHTSNRTSKLVNCRPPAHSMTQSRGGENSHWASIRYSKTTKHSCYKSR
jgi:hypothetical protein